MTDSDERSLQDLSGDELVRLLSALSNPHRLRILAVLAEGAVHVSQLAREVRLSRPLVHMHLQRLEAAGLVTGRLELSSEGRALKFFEVRPFALRLTPEVIAAAAKTVTTRDGERSSPPTEEEKPRRRSPSRASRWSRSSSA